MTRTLGVAVIGAGGENIATSCHLPALRQVPAMELVALHDVNAAGVLPYAAEYAVAAYTDLEAMLARDDVAVVQVCSPDPFHAEQTIAALEAGKHVLCQKPMALTLDDAHRMIAAAEAAGRKLSVCHNMRWLPRYRKLKDLVAGGRIGDPVHGSFSLQGRHFPYPPDSFYRTAESGGQFVHNGPHYVDLLCWLLGDPPTRVFARTARHFPTADRLATDNYVSALIRTEKGAIAWVEMNLMMPDSPASAPEQSLLLVGTEGTLRWSSQAGAIESFGPAGSRRVDIADAASPIDSFAALMTDFAAAILDDREPAVTPRWSARILEICLAAARG